MTKANGGVTWWLATTFAAAVCVCLSPVHAAVTTNNGESDEEAASAGRGTIDIDSALQRYFERKFTASLAEPSIFRRSAAGERGERLAQFSLPKQAPASEGQEGQTEGEQPAEARKMPRKTLPFEYTFGLEAEAPYLRNADLDSSLLDNFAEVAPTMFGSITWRPWDWIESRLEITIEQLFAIQEESVVMLPDGSTQRKDPRPFSTLVDQLYIKLNGPVELLVGRRNFEDRRLWLWDTSLDGVSLTWKPGDFAIEAAYAREEATDLDLTANVTPTGKIDNTLLYAEYRGIEDHKFAAYWMRRDDTAAPTSPNAISEEGEPVFMGLRAQGRPMDSFNYWNEFGFLGGRDELGRDFSSAYAFEFGGTYRFLNAPLQPTLTASYAWASGDKNPNDNENTEYRQTGMQSNEGRFGGVTQFVRYGEALAPELSNLRILTLGGSIRPAPGVFIDLVFNRYWLNVIDTELRSSNLTALMNQIESEQKKDVGSAIDLILGFRNLFGVKGLGFETRAGVFFPGDAFNREDRLRPDKAISGLAIMFY